MRSSSIATILLFSCLLAYLETSVIVSAADAVSMQGMVNDACVRESSLSPDDTKRVTDGRIFAKDAPAASRNLQCYVLCYFKKLDIIDADGKAKPEGITKFLEAVVKDKTKIKPALEKCATAKGENACEMAFNFEKCVFEQIGA